MEILVMSSRRLLEVCGMDLLKRSAFSNSSWSSISHIGRRTSSSSSSWRNKVNTDKEKPVLKEELKESTGPMSLEKKGDEDETGLRIKTAQELMKEQAEIDAKKRFERDIPPKEEERHIYWKDKPERSVNKSLIRVDFFQNMKDKNKENFLAVLEVYSLRDVHSRGHVEFIYAALSQMKDFGVHRDLEAYKGILNVFPKGRMISANMFQVEFMHYPKQQQCALDALEQMEEYGVMPDTEVQQMLTNIFGSQSFPMRKASRMLYWMPKFKHLSPWPLPDPLPENPYELAKIAIQRITSVDLTTKISVYQTVDLEDSNDDTWIVSGQSVEQQNLIASHPSDQPIYVEGAFRVWIQRNCINYFILRAEPRPIPKREKSDVDDVSVLTTIFEEKYVESEVATIPTVHEQDDGVILGVCATGTSSRDSLLSWIRFLEEANPRLGRDISVLFTLKSPIGPTDDLEVLPYEEVGGQLKQLGDNYSGGFSIGSGGTLGVDPRLPNLKKVGVWTESETEFPNWPHAHHKPGSISAKLIERNEKLLREHERKLEIDNREGPQRIQPTADEKSRLE